jgi:hypothetical protein
MLGDALEWFFKKVMPTVALIMMLIIILLAVLASCQAQLSNSPQQFMVQTVNTPEVFLPIVSSSEVTPTPTPIPDTWWMVIWFSKGNPAQAELQRGDPVTGVLYSETVNVECIDPDVSIANPAPGDWYRLEADGLFHPTKQTPTGGEYQRFRKP